MGLLGSMSVAFKGDTTGLEGAVSKVGGLLGKLAATNPIAAGFVAAGLAVVGFAAASIKAAGDFQEMTTQLVTGAGESANNLAMIRSGILGLSVDTATSVQQLTSGMFMIESASYHGADGLAVLKVAAEGAKVGNADLGTVANSLTTILHDYHMSASQSAEAMNGLTATVQNGKMHLQDLASSMGSVLPLASALGVSFPQVAGAIAEMTNSGMPARRAAMNLANAIRSLAAPNSSAIKSMKSVGLTAQQLKDMLSTKGLTATIQLVNDAIGKKFPAGSVQAVTAFKNIMGGATGYNVALMLGGQHMADYKKNVAAISSAMSGGAGAVEGWTSIQGDFNFKMAQAKESINAVMIKIGTALLPVLTKIVGAVTPVITAFANWLTQSNAIQVAIDAVGGAIQVAGSFIQDAIAIVQAIIGWFIQWHVPIMIVVGAITAFFLPALIASGVQALIAGGQIAASFIASMVTSGAEAVTNAAKVTGSFVASMVQTGAAAWVQGPKVIASFVASMVTSGAKAIWAAAQIIGSFVASMVTTAARAVATAATVLATFVASMATTGAKAIWAALQVTGSFVASMIVTAAQALTTAAVFVASLIPAVIAFAAEALTAAAVAIPAILAGFGAWIVGALAVAAANIAAFWPIYLVIGIIAAVIALVILAVKNWGAIAHWLQGAWSGVIGFFSSMWANIQSIFGQVRDWFKNIWNGVVSDFQGILGGLGNIMSNIWTNVTNIFKGGVNWFIDRINWLIDQYNNLPKFGAPNLGHIPHLALGGQVMQSGLALVGERGAEVVSLPGGSSVYPHGTMPASSGGTGSGGGGAPAYGNQTVIIELDGQTLAQVTGDRQARLVRLKQGRRAA